MDIKSIKDIIKEAVQLGISEFSLENEGFKFSFKKGGDCVCDDNSKKVVDAVKVCDTVVNENQREKKGCENVLSYEYVSSPIVGVFYSSPDPGKPPFVKVGDIVNSDTVVCIIEAMKVMNEIKAKVSGRIVNIFFKDGQAVEFGAKMFEIDTEI